MKEMEKRRGGMQALLLTLCLVLALGSPGMLALGALPDALSLTAGSQACLDLALPVQAGVDAPEIAQLHRSPDGLCVQAGQQSGAGSLVLRLMGVLPVKEIDLEVTRPRMLIPGGQTVGIAIETQGLIVVGMSDLGTSASPARKAGLKSGDVIVQVNGESVQAPDALAAMLEAGIPADVTVMRKGTQRTLSLTPLADPRDGMPRIGAWVRSSTAGVGTLTYIDPETGDFAALGHAIADVDTGVTMPVARGGLYESGVAQIIRGEDGRPGELVGDFLIAPEQIGEITKNSDHGVFGTNYAGASGRAMPVAARGEVHTGACELLSAVDGSLRSYACEIEEIRWNTSDGLRALSLRVTDPELIALTGGIVQGMSGSPIIQDGKLVGAVTHVLVNDPTRGYGIFIENMLEAAG